MTPHELPLCCGSLALAAAAALACTALSPDASGAEPPQCLSFVPSDWPSPAKPYIMIAFDTSGSMQNSVGPNNSCGYPNTRVGHGRCAVWNTVQAYAGLVNFGLASFARRMLNCDKKCYDGCAFQNLPNNAGGSGCNDGCGPEPNPVPQDSRTRAGANILVELLSDLVAQPPQGNVPQLLSWVDNDCTSSVELFADGCTPLNGILRDMYRYYADKWAHPSNNPTYSSPLRTANEGERACRSLNVILVTDGGETCDNGADAIDAAADLLAGFDKNGMHFSVKTFVIDFGNAGQLADDIAFQGGTVEAQTATDEVSLSIALSKIITSAIQPEKCDNQDNNCNGCTDEGFVHYCNQGQDCCDWKGDGKLRQACLDAYVASITQNNPAGDLKLLPCTTQQQRQGPSTWLCFDPRESCDELDNNCEQGVDEGLLKCGNPKHCPALKESCNGEDDDCDGNVDEDNVCAGCTPSSEVCDGCDNDCDGVADNPPQNGFPTLSCGLQYPPNCQGTVTCQSPQPVEKGTCAKQNAGYGKCSNKPQAESCDGADNDCNGAADDGIKSSPCEPPNNPPNLDYGPQSQCKLGQSACVGSQTVCLGGAGPSTEVCDGIDNDCNGKIDDNAFAVGTPCGVNKAPCTPGKLACVGVDLVCQGSFGPNPEVCDGVDNDCDGDVDEPPLADAPKPGESGCWSEPGQCCSHQNLKWCPPTQPLPATCHDVGQLAPPCNKGTLACAGKQGWECQGPKTPAPESCDGIDNDCNGKIDDGPMPKVGEKCGSNAGVCKEGTLTCAKGVLDCDGDVPPDPPEKCNGLDDDCDGEVDNGIPSLGSCPPAYDKKLYPGDRDNAPCQAGTLECDGKNGMVCKGGVGPQPETCDGVDNDCDGKIDEAGAPPDGLDGSSNPLPPPEAKLGEKCGEQGGACQKGSWSCLGGVFACAGAVDKTEEKCDCEDNDCDGNTDEAPGPDGTPLCGPGKSCTKTADGCQCAGKCLSGEFPCPGGQKCEQVTLTETGDKALYCVPDLAALCGDCAKKTVKDGDDKILCAPAGTDPPGCTSTPVCACKGAAGCREPCHGVPCGEGKVCSSFGVHAGQCVEDNCYLTGCPGCGKLCNLGTCADNPCAPESCPEGQACKPESDFEGFDCLPSCGAVECEDGQECRDGECVPSCDPACKPGEICDLAGPKCVSDKCAARSECADGSCCDPFTGDCGNCPCEGVICPAGQQCELGQCHGQGPGTGGAGGGGGGSGGEPSCPLPAGGGGPGQGAVWRLPSGGGGCLCGLAPGRPLAPQGRLGGAALVALALALAARRRRAPLGALLLLAGGGLLGCKTEALCAGGCPDGGPAASSGTGTCGQAGSGATGEGGTLFVPDGGAGAGGGEAGGGGCEKTGETEKKCNGIDDDCDGEVDEDVDLHGKASCGSCENNCLALLANADPDTISCQWDGKSDSPGKCSFKKCAADYYDLDKDGKSCEYYCVKTADGDGSCNLKDDDCDGKTDEDADLCADADNCGKCGNKCAVVHGQGKCVDSGKKPCDVSNTHCAIASCNDDDKDGKPDWWDLDKSYATGCEYHCSPTNGGGEICGDGIDNDCDGKIDAADDLSKDPQMGQICYGDPDGLCSSFEHAGKKTCQGTKVVCVGSEVLVENQIPEKCNGVDDDCDGKIDDDPQDAGKACGKSNLFPCVLGSEQCQGGQLVCVGAIEPKAESCNGIDDDCDGKMDLAGNKPPADATGSCLEPKPPPPGATSPCKAGTKACVGGTVVCQGAVTAPLPSDACGEDSNCNGVLESQPDLKTDVHHCGSCPKDCYAGSKSSVWSCKQGTCAFEGCLPGYSDPYKKQTCEYPCVVNGAEQCNGVDDDCDGLVDANVQAPSPVKACGVSPGAARPECTGQVEVKCVGGGWQCKFPGGVCEPDCAKAVEICDGLDNDCDGAVNENVSNYGKSCASDDGLPPPGHGACRTTGTFVCDGSNKTKCSAVAKSCQDIPGGCEEKCDGVDNDCDGSVDEPFDAKGKVTAHFVRPAVTQIGQSVWIYSFEASRPGATDKSAGAGNGYRCSGGGCPPGIPPAPPFVTLDGTGACSVAGRLPWFNVTPVEVEQICEAAGGYACDLSDWQTACWTDKGCSWGYHPRGSDCQSAATGNKFCNLAAFDFDPNQPGTQHGLLPTASNKLAHCWADWAGLLGNGQNAGVSDITGNLREIVKTGQAAYALMGGAFDSMMEPSASCDFTFYAVDGTFQLFDSGFRCCFIKDPTQ